MKGAQRGRGTETAKRGEMTGDIRVDTVEFYRAEMTVGGVEGWSNYFFLDPGRYSEMIMQ